MAESSYSFKKEAKVYIVYNNKQYHIDISEITFNQTFVKHSYSTKTVQVQNMFKQSIINKANPANFELTFPAIREGDFRVLFNRALDTLTFDLYIVTTQDSFKIENCVVTNAIFNINRFLPLSISLTGEASKLTREGNSTFNIPGVPIPRSSTMTYNRLGYTEFTLGLTEFDFIVSINVALQNDIKWIPNTKVKGCGSIIVVYPETFTIGKKTLSGSITRYSIGNIDWSTNTTLYIKIGQKVGSIVFGFEFDLDKVIFTNRTNTGQIFTQSYDWRMIQNPDSLFEIITYITQPEGVAGAILDSDNQAILDSFDLPILESL